MESKHCKPAFERADPDRRNKVIQTAVDEFSGLGFENANINVIAKKAGISIGLMYKYFETKEDLFILCLEEAISELHAVIEAVLQSDDKILVRAEKLIRAIQQTSGRESRYVKLYNEITKMSVILLYPPFQEFFSDYFGACTFFELVLLGAYFCSSQAYG